MEMEAKKLIESLLKPDGERFLPEFNGVIALEHYHRYFCTLQIVKDKNVLDLASGEGFGSNILSHGASNVVGVDISPEAIHHARQKYMRNNLEFKIGSAIDVPVESGVIDVVVSFETLEHFSDHERFFSEIKRVLKPSGFVIISTPNRLVYSDQTGYSNPFHTKELYTAGFLALASRYFSKIGHFGQRVTVSSVIASANSREYFSTFRPNSKLDGIVDQTYDIVVASDIDPPGLGHSIFEDPNSGLHAEKLEEVVEECQRLRRDLEFRRLEFDELVLERDALRSLLELKQS
jgi:SAM-dependent methyltransferase